MYINILSLFALIVAVECSLWQIIGDLINTNVPYIPEDANLNITQLANKYGYNIETHTVATEDGYILNFHRMPGHNKKNNPAVFLMHGIMECSDSWLLQGPNISLAFVLADEGFDVWMGNARGNRHSLEHTSLNYTLPKYWKFSWEEIGVYDLPAMIDHVLQTTGKDSLYYIGHSQGTTSGYVLLSMKPEYNKKIKILFSLAPEAWMSNIKSPILRLFSPAANVLGPLLINYNSYMAGTDFFNKISSFICHWLPTNCDNILYALSGQDNKINDTLLPVILGHMPTGSSTLQFIHYGQLVNSRRFCRYDHGYETNMELYGQDTPPDYNLSNIVAQNVLYYSGNDWLSDPKDVETLKKQLPNVLAYIYMGDYTHTDYLYAAESRDAIYMKIVAQMNKYEDRDDGKHNALREFMAQYLYNHGNNSWYVNNL